MLECAYSVFKGKSVRNAWKDIEEKQACGSLFGQRGKAMVTDTSRTFSTTRNISAREFLTS